MTWIEFEITAQPEAFHDIGLLLMTLGYQGDFIVQDEQRPGRLRGVVPDDQHAGQFQLGLEQGLISTKRHFPDTTVAFRQLDEAAWAATWRPAAGPARIGEHFVIVPDDLAYSPAPDDVVITLEAGPAFGTGHHPATHLCLLLLERYAQPGLTTLDLGCGSGILTIALAKLGSRVLALDNDTAAIEATERNVERNDVDDLVVVRQGSLGAGADLGHWMGWDHQSGGEALNLAGTFDLIVANVLSSVHRVLAGEYRRSLHIGADHGGLLITSGIKVEHAAEIDELLQAEGFERLAHLQMDEWAAFAHYFGP